jgi:hypothetical protein
MARALVWVDGPDGGWSCSGCRWIFPIPTLLSSRDARDAYDRLAAGKFNTHSCESEPAAPTVSATKQNSEFADRVRGLITRGFKPKVAIELALHEIEFEFRNSPKIVERARVDADEFLQKIGKGLI